MYVCMYVCMYVFTLVNTMQALTHIWKQKNHKHIQKKTISSRKEKIFHKSEHKCTPKTSTDATKKHILNNTS